MKKFLVLLLAVVVLTGSLTPCCVSDNCADEIASATANHHDEQEHEQTPCSPFFACGYCTGFVQLAKQYNVTAPEARPSVHHEKLTHLIASAYYSSFFQPPRNS